ncbi:MAG: TetR/AcrR family transcriptional regulator [Alphaproteobacteria bacterium]|nr:TetR/AcrR family transcriptional regulator [Alphaproteobacteria bacterium]
MPRLSDEQQAERRTRLLDAAERCFARAGFHATTMHDIAREARVSAGAAYTYFASKEGLIAGIADRDRRQIAHDFGAVAEAEDFIAALEACARFYLIEQPAHKRTLMVELAAESTRNAAVARACQDVDKVVQDAFTHAIERQVAAGRLQPRHELRTIVSLLMVIGDGLFQRRATDPRFDPERALPVIMALMREMVGAKPAGRAPAGARAKTAAARMTAPARSAAKAEGKSR